MKGEMKNGKISGISTVLVQEKLKVTCVERKYRVSDSKIGFIVIAKKEFDEDATQELLHEDVELKTFLENYQITDIVSKSQCEELTNVTDKKVPTIDVSIDDIEAKESLLSTRSRGVLVKKYNVPMGNRIQQEARKRRELFDSLNLSETFVIKDYKRALEEKGIIITNTAMPYDDMDWLVKQEKVTRIGKGERGAVTFRIKKSEDEIVA